MTAQVESTALIRPSKDRVLCGGINGIMSLLDLEDMRIVSSISLETTMVNNISRLPEQNRFAVATDKGLIIVEVLSENILVKERLLPNSFIYSIGYIKESLLLLGCFMTLLFYDYKKNHVIFAINGMVAT